MFVEPPLIKLFWRLATWDAPKLSRHVGRELGFLTKAPGLPLRCGGPEPVKRWRGTVQYYAALVVAETGAAPCAVAAYTPPRTVLAGPPF